MGLHGLLGSEAVQDSGYRWWPKTRATEVPEAPPAGRTLLAKLCRYYLECLSRESGAAISIPAEDEARYLVLDELPFIRHAGEIPAADRAIRRLLQKVRS